MHRKMINAGWDGRTLAHDLLCRQERASREASPVFLAKMRLSIELVGHISSQQGGSRRGVGGGVRARK